MPPKDVSVGTTTARIFLAIMLHVDRILANRLLAESTALHCVLLLHRKHRIMLTARPVPCELPSTVVRAKEPDEPGVLHFEVAWLLGFPFAVVTPAFLYTEGECFHITSPVVW